MSWTGVLDTIGTHLTTAGATITPPITKVRRGEPFHVGIKTLAYWYDGDQESETGGNTVGGVTNIQERVTIRGYWPVPTRDDPRADALEVELQAVNRAIQAALWGDAHLGENCIGLDIGNTSAGWQQWGEAWARVLTIPLIVDMANVETISG